MVAYYSISPLICQAVDLNPKLTLRIIQRATQKMRPSTRRVICKKRAKTFPYTICRWQTRDTGLFIQFPSRLLHSPQSEQKKSISRLCSNPVRISASGIQIRIGRTTRLIASQLNQRILNLKRTHKLQAPLIATALYIVGFSGISLIFHSNKFINKTCPTSL